MSRIALFIITSCVFLAGCQPKVATVPGAENMRITSEGRLFSTGSQGIYEIKKEDRSHSRTRLNTEPCQHLGLTEMKGWLFSVCLKNYPRFGNFLDTFTDAEASLWAYPLSEKPETAKLVNIGDLTSFFIPNGMDTLKNTNQLVIADENFFEQGGVSLVSIDFSDGTPKIERQSPFWIANNVGVAKANGVRVIDNSIFLTDQGTIKRVDLNEQGEPQPAQTIYSDGTILDDLSPFCDGVVAADFIKGRLVYASKDGTKKQVIQTGLFTPSSVMMQATPMFDEDVYLVTEVGRFFEGESNNAKGRILEFSKSAMKLSCETIGVAGESPATP